MGFAKGVTVMSPLLPLALAVLLSFWAQNAQPAEAYRALKASANQEAQTDFLGNPVDVYGCGYYDSNDPQDGGIAHQPCFGADGSIQFCCLSGSSKCSCPATSGSDLGCYNYEAGNNLNANTGDECGYFLPEGASPRRQLAGCTCPDALANNCAGTLSNSVTGPGGVFLFCTYTPFRLCTYTLNTGYSVTNTTCCPFALPDDGTC